MADKEPRQLTPPTPEQRRVAAGQFERANQVISTGNHDYGIQLLMSCCHLDPGNLLYRHTLRKTEKAKYNNNLKGSRLAVLTTSGTKTRLKAAKAARDYLKVLEYGEEILARNPWDTGTQMAMSEAAEALGLMDIAVFSLDQARQKDPKDATVNRAMARLFEKRGNFTQAIGLWELVRKADPRDIEAQHKGKDLAASDTIARGKYEAVVDGGGTRNASENEAAKDTKLSGSSGKHKPLEVSGTEPAVPSAREPREAAGLWARIKAEPTAINAYLQLANVYRRSGMSEQARAVLQEGLGPTGNPFELAVELADLEAEPFRRNLAITEEKLKATPRDAELHKIRTRLIKEINARELDLFRQKAERYPTEMGNRLELGVRLFRAGQIDGAIVELQAARADPRLRWRALMHLGHCFASRDNWRLAERNFAEALQQLPPGEDAMRKELLYELAKGAAKSGDLSHAVELAYELANLDFGYKDISQLLDEWQGLLQKV
jgi:tetratricopeptide (TPR) repeat protein